MPERPAADAALGISFLGQPRLTSRGDVFAFRGRPRSLALLAYLLLHRHAHLTRDVLAFALWPDDSEADARANLRRHLHHLTTSLPASGGPYVSAHEDTIRWNPQADVWFDVDVFERLAGDEYRLADAVAMYGGDLLPGVYDDWIFPVRDRLRRTFLTSLEGLMQRSRSRREFGLAKTYAGSILVHDPWREDTLRQLASICYESGDRAGALREIDAFAERLAREMSVEPMPETVALRARILRGGETGAAGGTLAAEQRSAHAHFPFVGRRAERESVESAWRRAARSRGDVVFIAGEAGIGKSRLAGEIALLAEAQGGRVLCGGTNDPEPCPYAALVEALRDALPLLHGLDVRPIWLAVLGTLLPELALGRADLPPVPPLDPQRERLRLFEALASVVSALSRQRPVLLVLEDLHWAGEATLGALEYLARRSAGMSALIIATYRSDARDTNAVLAALRRRLQLENISQHLPMGGLDADAIGELARSVPGLGERAGDIAREVHALSGGNPFFAGELLRERAESDRPEVAASGLRATLEARIGRLSDNAAFVAKIASVIGAAFEIDLVRDVCGWEENAILGAVGELLERSLVREVGRARFAFTFTHSLIATAMYGTIEPQRRRHWHERIASSIERLNPDRDALAGTLAAHFDAAGAPARAWPYYLTSARRSFGVFANAEALAAVTRALELIAASGPDVDASFGALGLRERIRGRLGDREGQLADIEALAELAAERADDGATGLDILWRRALYARAGGDLVAEQMLLAQFMSCARDVDDRARIADGHAAIARNRIAASRYDEARDAAGRALDQYRALAAREGEIEALCLLSEIAVNHGLAEQVDACLADAQRIAAVVGERVLSARVAMARAAAAIMRRDFILGRDSANEALLRYREIGDREGEADALVRVASALSMLSRFDETRTGFTQAADIYRSIGNRLKLAYLLFNQSPAEMLLGLFGAANESLSAALAIFESLGDSRGLAACRTNLCMIRLISGAAHEARAIGLRAVADARAIQNPLIEAAALANLGNAERELGDFDSALANMHAAIGIRRSLGLTATFEELGDLALTQLGSGDRSAARATADDLMARAPLSGENTIWPHHCFWAAACVYAACGDDERASQALAHAARHVDEQLAAIVDERARSAFTQLRGVRLIRAARDSGSWPPFVTGEPAVSRRLSRPPPAE